MSPTSCLEFFPPETIVLADLNKFILKNPNLIEIDENGCLESLGWNQKNSKKTQHSFATLPL
ncbi:hypothetical protein QR98_0082700 [Sarcoptes scabiei]|uniref:Uncharacterized protein n=1 Tax=Sarcoptes scabiei TaxID=52283 RepID=A0A132AGN4_SARSC|nr:hypothetical protein QR98_0082700 [Sarcoptes scabiei]